MVPSSPIGTTCFDLFERIAKFFLGVSRKLDGTQSPSRVVEPRVREPRVFLILHRSVSRSVLPSNRDARAQQGYTGLEIKCRSVFHQVNEIIILSKLFSSSQYTMVCLICSKLDCVLILKDLRTEPLKCFMNSCDQDTHVNFL